jgi:hypothetical protein
MVAAGCMVLYGYDAAVFNAVQANTYWLKWFNTPVRNPWEKENNPVLTTSGWGTSWSGQYNIFDRCHLRWLVPWWPCSKSYFERSMLEKELTNAG